jgi:hypothetical protein
MAQLRPSWSRTTVAKLEGMKRQDVSIGDWMALAMVLGVPPVTLIADPRVSETVPIPALGDAPTDQWHEENVWNVLWWLLGRNQITTKGAPPELEFYFQGAMPVITIGWQILDATYVINTREDPRPDADEDELARIRERENSRDTDAIARISLLLDRLDAMGVPRPPIHPTVTNRARQLNFQVDDWVTG